jgi:hypothetical protein
MKQVNVLIEEYLRRVYELLGESRLQNAIREYVTEQCAAERERCAKIAEAERDMHEKPPEDALAAYSKWGACDFIARRIRSGE